MRRVFYFLLLFFVNFMFVNSVAFSSGKYFDFSPNSRITNYQDILNIKFLFDMPEKFRDRFVIKPAVRGAKVDFVLDEDEDITNQGQDQDQQLEVMEKSQTEIPNLWSNLPTLSQNYLIEIKGNFKKTKLWFEILDTKTGKIYKTKEKEIWSKEIFDKYREKLNANLSKW